MSFDNLFILGGIFFSFLMNDIKFTHLKYIHSRCSNNRMPDFHEIYHDKLVWKIRNTEAIFFDRWLFNSINFKIYNYTRKKLYHLSFTIISQNLPSASKTLPWSKTYICTWCKFYRIQSSICLRCGSSQTLPNYRYFPYKIFEFKCIDLWVYVERNDYFKIIERIKLWK